MANQRALASARRKAATIKRNFVSGMFKNRVLAVLSSIGFDSIRIEERRPGTIRVETTLTQTTDREQAQRIMKYARRALMEAGAKPYNTYTMPIYRSGGSNPDPANIAGQRVFFEIADRQARVTPYDRAIYPNILRKAADIWPLLVSMKHATEAGERPSKNELTDAIDLMQDLWGVANRVAPHVSFPSGDFKGVFSSYAGLMAARDKFYKDIPRIQELIVYSMRDLQEGIRRFKNYQ